jgi:hypothetical protein
MADQLDNIVKVTITRQTSVPSMASFSEHLVVDMFNPAGITPAFDADHRVREFGGIDEIAEAGFPVSGYVYRAAAKQFAQSPHIGKILVGIKLSSDTTWTAALNAIKAQNNEWYGISVSSRLGANQQEIINWIQSNEKLGIVTSGDSNIPDEESGDIAAWAKLNNIDRVAVFYHPDAALVDSAVDALAVDDPIPEAAYFGKQFTKHPGSATWKFKSLQSVPTYTLTQGQVSKIEDKNATWYMTTAGIPMTSDGKVASGEYIDVIHGLDWLKARIQNLVFTPMVQQDKIPFTDAGVQIIVSCLRAALEEGVQYNILASYDISYPAVADLAQNWKAERTLPDINFTAPLAGAIHRTIINGTITL